MPEVHWHGDLSDQIISKRTPSDSHLALAIGKSTVFGIVASATQVGTRLITVPIVIHHLGLSGYGIWSIIMATVAYMRFGTAGVKSAFQKYVAEATVLTSRGSSTLLRLSPKPSQSSHFFILDMACSRWR